MAAKVFKDFAGKYVKAEAEAVAKFVECCVERGLTPAEARAALATYRKAKVVKFDHIAAEFRVTHGAFWDPDLLWSAVIDAEAGPCSVAEDFGGD